MLKCVREMYMLWVVLYEWNFLFCEFAFCRHKGLIIEFIQFIKRGHLYLSVICRCLLSFWSCTSKMRGVSSTQQWSGSWWLTIPLRSKRHLPLILSSRQKNIAISYIDSDRQQSAPNSGSTMWIIENVNGSFPVKQSSQLILMNL